ncbi:YlcI/YnfO family protein [Escherichia coli]
MSTKNKTRRTTTRNIRFPNQMIEQINIALEQKGSGNFSAWVIEACRRMRIFMKGDHSITSIEIG